MLNKKGDGYIPICVLIVILCMMLAIFITFVSAVNIVRQTKRNSRVVLDNYVMQNSIEIYDEIKNGSTDLEELDSDRYADALASFCTFEKSGGYMYSLDSEGNTQYRITKPNLSYTTENKLMLQVNFNVIIPMDFAGIHINDAVVPVSITSEFKSKY